jgi:hypothetical protein
MIELCVMRTLAGMIAIVQAGSGKSSSPGQSMLAAPVPAWLLFCEDR